MALGEKVGPADAARLAALLEATTGEALLAVGRSIDSQRVLDDALRIYQRAWTFYQSASAAKKKKLPRLRG